MTAAASILVPATSNFNFLFMSCKYMAAPPQSVDKAISVIKCRVLGFEGRPPATTPQVCKWQSENNEGRCILGPALGNARTALVSFVACRHPEMKSAPYITHPVIQMFSSLVSLSIPPNDFISVLSSSLVLLNSHSFIHKAVSEQIHSNSTPLNSQNDQRFR